MVPVSKENFVNLQVKVATEDNVQVRDDDFTINIGEKYITAIVFLYSPSDDREFIGGGKANDNTFTLGYTVRRSDCTENNHTIKIEVRSKAMEELNEQAEEWEKEKRVICPHCPIHMMQT
jgi:hypothetical protein